MKKFLVSLVAALFLLVAGADAQNQSQALEIPVRINGNQTMINMVKESAFMKKFPKYKKGNIKAIMYAKFFDYLVKKTGALKGAPENLPDFQKYCVFLQIKKFLTAEQLETLAIIKNNGKKPKKKKRT